MALNGHFYKMYYIKYYSLRSSKLVTYTTRRTLRGAKKAACKQLAFNELADKWYIVDEFDYVIYAFVRHRIGKFSVVLE